MYNLKYVVKIMKDKKQLIKIIISWFLVVIWMIIIFMLSNTPAKESTRDSKKIISDTIVTTTTVTNNLGITNYHPSELELNKLVKKINGPSRELMHSFEYLVLSILLLIALYNSNIKRKYIITFIICFIYILTDEYHQKFITGRSFQLLDIFMDTIGTFLGMFIYRLFKRK